MASRFARSLYAHSALDAFLPSTHLVSASWLAANLSSVTILDASWYLPSASRDAAAEYASGPRIPGARFFDIDAISDRSSPLPHMLPAASELAAAAASLGVSLGRPVVVYDGAGLFSAARVWWSLRALGHARTAVLDGGLPGWVAGGHPVERGAPPPLAPIAVESGWRLREGAVRSLAQMVHNALQPQGELLVDARPAARFAGEAPEPRAGAARGHVPRSRSVPASSLLDAGDHNRLLPAEALERVLRAAGVPPEWGPRPIVTSCGSGVTACIVSLALTMTERPFEATALYDGSWAEYGCAAEAPKCVGPPEAV